MAKQKEVFGAEELVKAFNRLHEKYPEKADAVLMTYGRQANKRVKQRTNKVTGKLRSSWRLRKVKLYKNGTVRVVREASAAPHAHLVELGHKMVTRERTRDSRGRYAEEAERLGKTSRLKKRQIKKFGVSEKGTVTGRYVLEKTIDELRSGFGREAEKMLDKMIKEFDSE